MAYVDSTNLVNESNETNNYGYSPTKIQIINCVPIYITSDNIISITTDNATINSIISGLKAMGLNAMNYGLGPNSHYQILTNVTIPQNALIIDIYGGADAGVINEMGSTSYKSIKGNRTIFSVFMPPATNISGLDFLPRAHDDNYDPVSFTGLPYPDHYLLENGYNYIYSGIISTIVNSIFYQATHLT
jgi:hypothetical protein